MVIQIFQCKISNTVPLLAIHIHRYQISIKMSFKLKIFEWTTNIC